MKHVHRLLRSLAALLVLVCLIFPLTLYAQSLPGIPEPGLIIYGRVLDRSSGKPVQANAVAFQVTGNNDTVNVAATLVSINGQSFYVAQVPFETRVVGVQNFQKTPNTVALTTGNTSYTRTATVNGKPATFKAAGTAQFLFGATERGRIERLDLEGERIIVDVQPGPQINLKPILQNGALAGIAIEWTGATGKTYSIYRTSDLGKLFEKIGSVTATSPVNRFSDPTAKGPGPYFYFLAIDP